MSDDGWLRLDQPATYEIRVQGWVSEQWQPWVNGMALSTEGGDGQPESTRLSGVVRDQAALLGLLQSLYTLGFVLLEVRLIEPEPGSDPPDRTGSLPMRSADPQLTRREEKE